MARHIMAVCVVCLLCADQLPCQQHLNDLLPTDKQQQEYQPLNAKVHYRTDFRQEPSSSVESFRSSTSGKEHAHQRRKRHVHEATPQHPKITVEFLKRILNEFSHGNESLINRTEFQVMLKTLGLNRLLEQQISSDKISNETCIADKKLVYHVQPHEHSSAHDLHTNCSQSKIGSIDNVQMAVCENIKENYTLNSQDMLNVCPVLLYQLVSKSEETRSGCITQSIHLSLIDSHEHHKENNIDVWIYAFISVFACSILGLVGVAIIPFMDSHYYKHILQFLVSLAVGTMTGDALLHLIPHSLSGQTEKNMILKGFTCMAGILFFYVTEHALTMISEWRKHKTIAEAKTPIRAKVVRDPDSTINNTEIGDRHCKSKYNAYPYCYDEIAMDTKNDTWMHVPNCTTRTSEVCDSIDRKLCEKPDTDIASGTVTQSLLSTTHNNYTLKPETNQHNSNHNHNQQHHCDHEHPQHLPEGNTIATDLDRNGVVEVNGDKPFMTEAVTVILREHESSHHGHSHRHGHVHSPPQSLSAVAWMIIMGDGLHNFTDGIAIGAAFAENIAGGFSTSLAVFCHELPHELGDFAILIKAGMTVKSAVYYNLLTGILSFVGMIFGIVFGQSPDIAQFMFAAAAGLFIYIALVDMMPELSSSHKSLSQFALQVTGLSSGVLIMLLIALFENDLMTVFSTSNH